jgi:Glycosyl hydrolase catalytic core
VPSGADYLCNTYRMGQSKAGWRAGAYPLDRIGQHLYIDQGGLTSSTKLASYLQDVRTAYVAFEGTKTTKNTEVTEFGWVANPSSSTYSTDAANQAQNVRTAYTTFRSTSYVGRADYFAAQDVPEGNVFYGLVQGDGVTFKPAFTSYQQTAVF